MLKKRLVLGLGATVLILGSFLGFACNDDDDDGNGDDGTPGAEEPTDTPEADATP